MPIPSSTPTASQVIYMSTVADALEYTIPVSVIRWHLTTAVTSTWGLQVLQSTVVQPTGSTVGWPIIGVSTATAFLGGSTGAGAATIGSVDYRIDNWLYGIVLTTRSGGFIEIFKAPPGLEWVRNKPPGY
jgi:hypothetical protein